MKKLLSFLLLAALLTGAGFAQDAPAAAPAAAPADESSPDRLPGIDVFRVLIKPEAPPPPVIAPTISSAPAPPPPPPPLQFSVKAIAGEAPHYVAVLTYNGNDYIAEEGWESDDHAFVVKRIGPNKSGAIEVEVYNKKTNRLAHKAYNEPKIPGYEGAGDTSSSSGGGSGDAGTGGADPSAGGGDPGAGLPPDAGGGGPPPDAGGGPPPDAGGPPPDAGGGADAGPPPP